MPRFEQYPLAESLPSNGILLLADPNDLEGDNPRVKRFAVSDLPQPEGTNPTVTTVTVENPGNINFPALMKTGDIVSLDTPASSSINTILFVDGIAGLPPEGAILILRNEKENTAVTLQHNPAGRIYLLQGQDIVMEGNRRSFVTFYVRRFPSPKFYELMQIGGGFY